MRGPKASARARRLLLLVLAGAAAAAGGAGAVSVAEFLELGEAPARAAPAPPAASAVLVNGTLAGLNLTRVWLKALGVRDYAAEDLGPGYAEVVAQATGPQACNPDDNLMRRVERLPQLATTATALRRSGLDIVASGPGPMTLLAPTDAAWAALSAELEAGGPDAQRLLDTSIERLMLYHLHGGLLDLTSAAPGAAPWEAPTLAGPPVTVAASPSAVTVDGATVASVQAACNGRLAVVDAVLIPPVASPVEAEPAPAPLPAPPADDQKQTIVRQDGEQLFRPAPAPDAAPCDADRECCDVPPPGSSHTCAEQAGWGKCADAWMAGFCRRSCGECDPEEGAEVAEADRRPGACAEDGVLVQVWDNAAKRESGKGASIGLYLSGGNKVALPAAARNAAAKGKGKATRFCGYFCPPVTGEYRFAQTAADRATFTLHDRRGEAAALGRETGGGGARRPPLARLEQAAATKPQAWEKRTPAVRLQQGVPYMVEALHFAAAGTSKPHFRLGVEFPNGLQAKPVAAAHFTASCGAKGTAEEQEVPAAAPPADPCACAGDGVSGGQATGQAGCFPYDVSAYFRNSDRAAAPIRAHLATADAWPAASLRVAASDGGADTYGRLWSAAYRAWAATGYREAPARMCYVVDPSRCPLAEPSSRWPGAAWRVCEAEP